MREPGVGQPTNNQRITTDALGIVGLSTLLSSQWCVDLAEKAVGAVNPTLGGSVFCLAFAMCCAVCARRAARGERVLPHGRLAAGLVLVGSLGGQALYLLAPLLWAPVAVKVAGGAVLGAAYAVVLLHWLALCCAAEPRFVVVLLSSAYLLCGVTYFVLAALHPLVAAVAVVLLPFVSGILCLQLQSRGALEPAGSSQEGAPAGGWSFPVRPVVLIAAFGFAFHFSLAFSSGASMYGPLGILVIASAALLAALFCKDGFNPTLLFKVALPCMVAGLLMISWVQVGANVATLFSNTGDTAFTLFVLIVLADASRRYRVNPFWLFGIAQGTAYAAICAGKLAGRAFITAYPAGTPESSAAMAVVVVGLVALCTFFPGERLALRTFGDGAADASEKAPELDEAGSHAVACAMAARRYGLSRREEEILGLLLQGMSAGQIEEELAISRSTVKSHIQHVYEKTGVHSRSELQGLIRAVG